MFTTNYNDILNKIENINPVRYSKNRNFSDGDITKLSPYISRGVISTKQVANSLFNRGFKFYEIETILKELTWRDYYQQVWITLKDDINKDIKHNQQPVNTHNISLNITQANTGIKAIDNGINELLKTGYMHNHMRMYVASLTCNVVQNHWFMPAQWMYYHLLDADWASNALSWQWVSGSFSNKKYYANQDNINKFFYSNQKNTCIDVSYEDIEKIDIPENLMTVTYTFFETELPEIPTISLNENLPTFVYNFYNIDPNWNNNIESNKILLLEPSFFKKYPACKRTINFIISLSHNIKGIQIFVGEFSELKNLIPKSVIHFKEHPTNVNYQGVEHQRDWIFEDIKGYYPSFFSYWKKCEKYLHKLETKANKSVENNQYAKV